MADPFFQRSIGDELAFSLRLHYDTRVSPCQPTIDGAVVAITAGAFLGLFRLKLRMAWTLAAAGAAGVVYPLLLRG